MATLQARIEEWGAAPAVTWRNREVTYAQLGERIAAARAWLAETGIESGSVVALVADFSPGAIAAEFALFDCGCVVVPLGAEDAPRHAELCAIAGAEWVVRVGEDDGLAAEPWAPADHPELIRSLTAARRPGLLLFSSGTTGAPKGALHDIEQLLGGFAVRKRPMRVLSFLLFDHIGGINTMFHGLLNGGCLVTVPSRAPDVVAETIERHRVEVLPTSPTFLNLLLLSGAAEHHDLSSLRVVTYGTEPMPEVTLRSLGRLLPEVKLHQTYGMTEFGIPGTRSRDSTSVWIRLDNRTCDHRVRDGVLEVRAPTAMLGYINAPSPFTDDGWLVTGDAVIVDGDWMRILGRGSELINVGGHKVVPVEVESVIEELDGVDQALVSGERSPLTGQVVCATVRLSTDESLPEFRARLRRHCKTRLPRYMIPQKVVLSERPLQSSRHKKDRSLVQPPPVAAEAAAGEEHVTP